MKRKQRRRTVKDKEEIAAFMQVLNRPWEAWEKEVTRRLDREDGLHSKNDERQRQAARDYQEYRDIAGVLMAENRQLRRATRHRLAQLVRVKLIEAGRGAVSVRTIERAFPKK
jgi:hypothetical protein